MTLQSLRRMERKIPSAVTLLGNLSECKIQDRNVLKVTAVVLLRNSLKMELNSQLKRVNLLQPNPSISTHLLKKAQQHCQNLKSGDFTVFQVPVNLSQVQQQPSQPSTSCHEINSNSFILFRFKYLLQIKINKKHRLLIINKKYA